MFYLNIGVVGYIGFQNFGDEWLYEKTKQCCMNQWGHTHQFFVINSKQSFFNILKQILTADRIVFAAGGLWQDKTSKRSLIFYLLLLNLVKLSRKPVYLLAQGIGPIKNKGLEIWMKISLKSIKSMSLREKSPIVSENCMIASDLAYYQSVISKKEVKENKIGVALRPSNEIEVIRGAIKKSVSQKEKIIHIISQINNDEQALFEANEHSKGEMPLVLKNPNQCLAVGRLISMRFHVCVLASLQDIPFFVIGVDEKLLNLAQTLNQGYIDCRSKKTVSQIASSIQSWLEKPTQIDEEEVKDLIVKASQHQSILK